MKTLLITTILTLSASSLLLAETPAPVAQEKDTAAASIPANPKTANDVGFPIVDQITSLFKQIVTVTDLETAKAFENEVNAQTPTMQKLAELLKTMPKPTDDELKAMAKKSNSMKKELEQSMGALMATAMNPEAAEVAQSLQSCMETLGLSMKNTEKVMEEYYPKDKMSAYMAEDAATE